MNIIASNPQTFRNNFHKILKSFHKIHVRSVYWKHKDIAERI